MAVVLIGALLGPGNALGADSIVSRGAASSAAYASDSTTSLTATAPSGSQAGDVLIASLGFGSSSAKAQPGLTAPSGWTPVSRTNFGSTGALVVYSHVYQAGETRYTWTTSVPVGGTIFIAAFGGVDAASPIDASKGQTITKSTKVPAPSVTTGGANEALVAGYYGYRAGASGTTWTPPTGMSEIGDASNGGSRAGALDYAIQSAAGASGTKTATSSVREDQGIGVLTALRPATGSPPPPPPPPSGPVPLIVDTDMFSNADDVGALATAFGLQLKGEARVIALGVNTRTSRPTVALNSWKCVAAIAQFYGAGDVPIGTDMPNNGTDTNSPDFTKPCAAFASPSTPAPDSAVAVYRRTLAAQPDGSVVMVGVGYEENLSALLDSPPDAISPLNGRQLVAQKVNRLVLMAGGYPSRNGETNLNGNPAAAQNVAANWPTKIVWSGYEVGDAVHTGQTISAVHPSSSPVRAAYEAFVGPGNWIYSYDLTAVYHAVRAADPLLSESGPGTNSISDTGANTFTAGAGNQYYLILGDANALDSSIEQLLDTLPLTPPPPASQGPNDNFDDNALDPTWTVGSSGSTVADANAELEITHPGGAWTSGWLDSVAFNATGHAVAVQLKRAANGGQGGSGYGETSVQLRQDGSHYAYFFVAGGSLTAWVNRGSGEVNLTTGWPAYDPATMQWLRFRESGGTLYWEYASGATSPGTWRVLTSTPDPFPMTLLTFRLRAGSNVNAVDVAQFDNVSTN